MDYMSIFSSVLQQRREQLKQICLNGVRALNVCAVSF